ncbi:hypothetical protein [Peribacillus simplex]|uniref:hypothetical protein n=1 Tax=Peribacillus simplex TaxID=1478 RepID=UPI003D2C954B
MIKEELFARILLEKKVIDPLLWLIKVEDKVDKTHEEYIRSMSVRYKDNPKILKLLEQYILLWEVEYK